MLCYSDYPSDTPAAYRQAEAALLASGAYFELELISTTTGNLAVFKHRPRSLRQLVEHSTSFGTKTAWIYVDENDQRHSQSFADFYLDIVKLTNIFQQNFGIGHGDRVAILAANCPEWLLSFWASVSLGAVVVAFNGWWTGAEIEYALTDTQPKLLIADHKRLARLKTRPGCTVLTMESDFPNLLTKQVTISLPAANIAETDPAAILYTSGTTGRPKGAVQTHRNICSLLMCNFFHGARLHLAAAIQAGQPPMPPPPATVLVTSPLFHVSGLHNAAVTCMAAGSTSVWLGGKFSATRALRLIQDEKITSWGYTETLLKRLLAEPSLPNYDLSSLKVIGGGGSNIAPELQALARHKLPTVQNTFGLGYGQTECGSLATLHPAPELKMHPTSVGRPVPTVMLDIRDQQGHSLPMGTEGEIYVKSPMVMPGYWNNPAATAAVLSADGWLNTGDFGHINNGRLYIASRKRDLIIRGGENIYPAEIEQRLETHPAVQEAAVVGVDSAEYGQEVKAFIVLNPGATWDPTQLANWVADGLAYYKVPKYWQQWPTQLPRNATGKVVKSALLGASFNFVEEAE